MDKEIWAPVPLNGFGSRYEVSTYGHVRWMDSKKLCRTNIQKNGYERLTLYANGEYSSCTIHRLVALAFIPNPNPEEFDQVGHVDDNKLSNVVSNLYWTNALENNNHGTRTERMMETLDQKRAKSHRKGRRSVYKLVPTSVSGVTAVYYQSMAEAARENGINAVDIRSACQGLRDTAGGYRWIYAYSEEEMKKIEENCMQFH